MKDEIPQDQIFYNAFFQMDCLYLTREAEVWGGITKASIKDY